jgi:hypothetical protein
MNVTEMDSDCSIALDPSGKPHISYSAGGVALIYVSWTGKAWTEQTVTLSGPANATVASVCYDSLVIDSRGNPHIAFINYTDFNPRVYSHGYTPNASLIYEELKYAWWNGTRWNMQTVDTGSGGRTSLALDSNGYPCIAYSVDSGLKYAQWNGTCWNIQVVDSGEVGSYPSLALGANGYAHISYLEYSHNTTGYLTNYYAKYLKYASWNGQFWNIQIVDNITASSETSLALDTKGNPHIIYLKEPPNNAHGNLDYVVWNGSSWNIQVVDYVQGGPHSTFALDSSGKAHLVYFGSLNELKYAELVGNVWNIQTVDSNGDFRFYLSMALDVAGRPHICYHDYTGYGFMKYATFT